MTYIVNLNEFSLVRFLILIMLRREVYVLWTETIFPQLKRLVHAIAEWSVRKGYAKWAVDLCPELVPEWDYPPRSLIHNIFADTEGWQNTYYEFAKAERSIPEYAYAYKQVTCCHTWQKHVPVLILRSILENSTVGNVKVVGLSTEDVGIVEALCRDSLVTRVKPAWIPKRLLNFAILLLNFTYGFGFVVARLKPFGVKPRSFFLAADYMYDPRDVRLYQELEEGGPILLVYRIAPPDTEEFPELANYEYCKPTDGAFSLIDAVSTLAMVVVDSLRTFVHYGHLDSAHFYKVAALPNRRAILRGLFNKYRPRYFWGRDPYNVDHVLRRQELNRIGGRSHGLWDGVPAYTIVFPHLRYVSFDRYYVYGHGVYERHYADTWPQDMALVPMASYSFTREQLESRFATRPPDIAVFTSIFVDDQGMIDFVRGLAEAFSDRKILLEVKWNFVDKENGKRYIAACTEGLPNVIPVRESVYDLFFKARYAFSDPSSVVYEGMQLGVFSFAVDVVEEQKVSNFREFPGLTVSSSEDAIERIRSIEMGEWEYPIAACKDLVDMSGILYLDAVRAGVGLPENEAASQTRRAGGG